MNLPPTETELARHREAFQKIRARVFSLYSPTAFLMVSGSECIKPLSVWWWERRRVTLGGITFRVVAPNDTLGEVTIDHLRGASFSFHLFHHKAIEPKAYFSRFATEMQFEELATRPYDFVRIWWGECLKWRDPLSLDEWQARESATQSRPSVVPLRPG